MLVPLSLSTRVTSALTENEWLSLFESEFLLMLLMRSSPSEVVEDVADVAVGTADVVDCWLSLVLSPFDLLKFPPTLIYVLSSKLHLMPNEPLPIVLRLVLVEVEFW